MELYERLRPGDAIYYASTLIKVTPQKILFMSKTEHKGFYEPIEITIPIAKRFNFVPNPTETAYKMDFGKGKSVTLYFEDCVNLNRIRVKKSNPTDTLKWDFEPMQFHELQQITNVLLNEFYED